ncbi:MAG: sialate O-acetylesterase [bacterium]|nr:sialate O-acetylesterase [bacterium]
MKLIQKLSVIVLAVLCVVGGAQAKPLKVFILSGQSNMEGKAAVTTLDAVINDPKTRDQFKHLKPDGKWLVRKDVWVTYLDRKNKGRAAPLHGPLTVGFGSPKLARDKNFKKVPVKTIGPELGIGEVLGDYYDQPVLLIKAAWGGRAVKQTFRPPSAMPPDDEIKAQLAAIKARKPEAGVTFESLKASFGSDYRKIISETQKVLGDIKKYVPDYDEKQGYEIAGFIWFQGWNDACGGGNPKYVEQMAHFIRDIRKDLKTPNMPFVIGELGTDGTDAGGWVATFRKQQVAIAALPEFKDNVRLAKTAHCWHKGPYNMQPKWDAFKKLAKANAAKPANDPTRKDPGKFFQINWVQKYAKELAYTSDKRYHYNGSGRSYYEMGQSMGKAMLDMIKAPAKGAASTTDGAGEYLKDGKLKKRIEIRELQGGFAGFTGRYYAVEVDGTFSAGSAPVGRRPKKTTLTYKLTEKQLAQLAAEFARHDLANLPSYGKPVVNPRVIEIRFGENVSKLMPPRGKLPKGNAKTVLGRYNGIVRVMKALNKKSGAKK